jgi:hypothetical protein
LKVIERNENYVFPKVAIKRQVTCPTCQSILEVTEKDIWTVSAFSGASLKACKVCFGDLEKLEITDEESKALNQKEKRKDHYQTLAFKAAIVLVVLCFIVGITIDIMI